MSNTQTVSSRLTPSEQDIQLRTIKLLTKVQDHLAQCKDESCHMRRFLRA